MLRGTSSKRTVQSYDSYEDIALLLIYLVLVPGALVREGSRRRRRYLYEYEYELLFPVPVVRVLVGDVRVITIIGC